MSERAPQINPDNVWGNKGDYHAKSFVEADINEVDYLINSAPIDDTAANDPFSSQAPEIFTRKAIETNPEVVKSLLGGSDLQIAQDTNFPRASLDDRDPAAPTPSQEKTILEINNSDRATNLNLIKLREGVPLKEGGEIPGNINEVPAVLTRVTNSWQEPAPLRADKPKSGLKLFLRKFFG